jgi:hypothetical protein
LLKRILKNFLTNFISIIMFFAFNKLVIIFLILVPCTISLGQTYTSNGSCTDWSNGNCWVKEDLATCTNSTSLYPPTNPTAGCPVNVIINHAMTSSTALAFGGMFGSITFGPDGSLNILGGINISSDYTLSVYGNASDTDNFIRAQSLEFNQNSTLYIDSLAGLIISGITNFKNYNGKIKVDGFYRTLTITTTGNSSGILEVDLNAKALIDGNVDMNGNSILSFIGSGTNGVNAEVEIGGRIKTNGANSEIIANAATVYICDGIDESVKRTEENNGKFVTMCRTLNISDLDLLVESQVGDRFIEITLILFNHSGEHLYVLERSSDGIITFEEVGAAYGWEIDPSVVFSDFNLPNHAEYLYYRIKQMERDEIISYSNIVRGKNPQAHAADSPVWKIFPNPYTNEGKLELKLLRPDRYQQEVIQCRLVSGLQVIGPFSGQKSEIGQILEKHLQLVPPGLVVVELLWGENMEVLKILKGK